MALTQVNSEGIKDGEIKNADINASAAIALSKLASTPAVLTGSTNNQITTVTGANAIQGEANLTFDGTKLGIGTASPGQPLHLKAASNATTLIQIEADPTGGGAAGFIGCIAAVDNLNNGSLVGELALRGSSGISFSGNNGTATQLRIDSSGRVLIGTTTEGYSPDAEQLTIASSTHGGITIRTSSTTQGSIYFSDGTSGADEYKGQVAYNHNTDQLHLTAGGNTGIQVKSSGAICKPNQPSASCYFNGSSAVGGTGTKISSGDVGVMNSTRWNTGSHYDTSNGRFTCPVAGKYEVQFNTNLALNNLSVSHYFQVSVYKNGSRYLDNYDLCTQANYQHFGFSNFVDCSASDYLDIRYSSTSNNTFGADSSVYYNSVVFRLVQ